MGMGASPLRDHLRSGIIEAPAAWVWGPSLPYDLRSPRSMGGVASFALGPPRSLVQARGGSLSFGIIEAPAAWAPGPSSLWNHPSLRCMGVESSFALGPSTPPPHGRGGLFRFGTTEVP